MDHLNQRIRNAVKNYVTSKSCNFLHGYYAVILFLDQNFYVRSKFQFDTILTSQVTVAKCMYYKTTSHKPGHIMKLAKKFLIIMSS